MLASQHSNKYDLCVCNVVKRSWASGSVALGFHVLVDMLTSHALIVLKKRRHKTQLRPPIKLLDRVRSGLHLTAVNFWRPPQPTKASLFSLLMKCFIKSRSTIKRSRRGAHLALSLSLHTGAVRGTQAKLISTLSGLHRSRQRRRTVFHSMFARLWLVVSRLDVVSVAPFPLLYNRVPSTVVWIIQSVFFPRPQVSSVARARLVVTRFLLVRRKKKSFKLEGRPGPGQIDVVLGQ